MYTMADCCKSYLSIWSTEFCHLNDLEWPLLRFQGHTIIWRGISRNGTSYRQLQWIIMWFIEWSHFQWLRV